MQWGLHPQRYNPIQLFPTDAVYALVSYRKCPESAISFVEYPSQNDVLLERNFPILGIRLIKRLSHQKGLLFYSMDNTHLKEMDISLHAPSDPPLSLEDSGVSIGVSLGF